MACKNSLGRILGDGLLVVVSNREPYIHTYAGDTVQCIVPAGGLTSALDPVMRACGGVWIAHGGGDADRAVVDHSGRIAVPPGKPAYWLRRIWLSEKQEEDYYYGFANSGLWPLCHIAYVQPVFDEVHWNAYKAVNQLFADAICARDRPRRRPLYSSRTTHLALVPASLKSELLRPLRPCSGTFRGRIPFAHSSPGAA